MGLLFFISAQPDVPRPPGPLLQELYEKGGHALAYAVLAWLYLRALQQIRAVMILRLVSAGLAVLYALSDEYHQTFVPGRSGDPLDVMMDVVGICGAMLLSWWLARQRQPRPPALERPNPPGQESPAR
jgi:VanZ family protein